MRGIGTYLRGLLDGFQQLGANHHVELLLRGGQPVPREIHHYGGRAAPATLPSIRRRLQPIADPFLVSAVLRRLKPTLYHGVEYAQPLWTSTPVVITVHDLIPFVFPNEYRWARRERLLALRQLRHADAVIADSASTAQDLERIAHVDGQRIRVIHLGVAARFAPASDAAVTEMRHRLRLNRPYLLAVGTFDPRKRIAELAKTYAAIRHVHDVDLVIIGDQGEFAHAVRSAFVELGITSGVHHRGYVSPADLVTLYSATECLLFTSAYEGFGLPPLEAMACGAPVALFANSSLREIAGDASLLCPDADSSCMASQVSALLSSPSDAARRRVLGRDWAARFTWRRCAEEILDVYNDVLANHSSSRHGA